VKRKIHPAFIVAGATFVVLLCAAAVRATPSILIVPLEREFGWSRALLSSAVSINLVLYGVVGPFAAALMERFGIRRTVLASLALIAAGVALTSQMRSSWQLMLTWGLLVGLGTGTTAMVLGATVVSRWFFSRRGAVMGVLTASTATGQMLFLPLEAHVVEHQGWRAVTFLVATVIALLVPLVALLVRDRPSDLGILPYGASPETPPLAPSRANPLANALRVLRESAHKGDFWLLAGSFFVCGATTNGLVGTHLVPACMDHGIPEVRAAGLLAVMGIFDLIGTTCSGWLSDRFDSRRLLFWYYGLRGLSLMVLPFTSFDLVSLSIFAVFYGLDWVATIPPTVALTNEVFGRRDAPVIVSWIVCGHQIGGAVAALGAGVLRNATGSYLSAFIVSGAACLIASLLVLRIARRPMLALAE